VDGKRDTDPMFTVNEIKLAEFVAQKPMAYNCPGMRDETTCVSAAQEEPEHQVMKKFEPPWALATALFTVQPEFRLSLETQGSSEPDSAPGFTITFILETKAKGRKKKKEEKKNSSLNERQTLKKTQNKKNNAVCYLLIVGDLVGVRLGSGVGFRVGLLVKEGTTVGTTVGEPEGV
jgi:hypothetical protein